MTMPSEVEKLRALLVEARRELGCIEALTVHPGVHNGPGGDALFQFLERIDAALAEPVVDPVQAWKDANGYNDLLAAYSSTITERDEAVAAFHEATRLRSGIQQARIKAENERDEARAKLALLERHYSPEAAAKLRAELAAANAEIASLRWDRETACENTPTKDCECPGCCTARERAERGEG
jgi:hypothetical protein